MISIADTGFVVAMVNQHDDFVDASIMAVAERLGIRRILTIDRRDFQIVRPRHGANFELLP